MRLDDEIMEGSPEQKRKQSPNKKPAGGALTTGQKKLFGIKQKEEVVKKNELKAASERIPEITNKERFKGVRPPKVPPQKAIHMANAITEQVTIKL